MAGIYADYVGLKDHNLSHPVFPRTHQSKLSNKAVERTQLGNFKIM